MPDKLTDKEIVKALRSWLEEIRKSRQAYLEKVNEEHYPSMRYEYLLSDTIHEINRLQGENEKLKKSKYIFSTVDYCADDLDKALEENKNLKAEAYKEFAERLHEELRIYGIKDKFNKSLFLNVVDKAKKELVGDSE